MNARIAWLVPCPIQGSGGHRTIFAHIRNLVKRGHECHVYIDADPHLRLDGEGLREIVEQFFGPCPAKIYSGYQVDSHYDLAVATAWWTAETVAKKVQADHKAYFVQDFEPCFNPMGDHYLRAEDSYRLGLIPITIGRWLSHLLRERYGSESRFFEFSADHSVYFPDDSVQKELAVCFIYQPEKPRRCPGIGRDVLAIVKEQCPDVSIYTYGSENSPELGFEHTHLGILSLQECNLLYNRCSVGLCLSSSNPSRIPFEMMAAGLPPVDMHGENTIYDLPEQGVLLAERNPSSLAGAILSLLQSPALREEKRQGGIEFMRQRYAALEVEQCASWMEAILMGSERGEESLKPLYNDPPFTAEFTVPGLPEDHSASIEGALGLWNRAYRRLCRNRIGRVLKVLWRGYY